MGEISQRPQGKLLQGWFPQRGAQGWYLQGGGSPKAQGQECWEITPQPGLGSPCQPRLWECAGSPATPTPGVILEVSPV